MKKRNAFTIIEVVLVLAIAGLIFLMVFIALPALQRSQRNTRRRQDAARIASAITDYYSNTGKMPFGYDSGTGFREKVYFDYSLISKYIDSEVSVPSETRAVKYSGYDFNEVTCPEGKSCEQFKDPNGSVYIISLAMSDTDAPQYQANTVFLRYAAKCDSDGKTINLDGQNAQFTVIMTLEGGSYYCADNS
ncbi:MAG: type II secretion system protein [Candidatus Saccharibacteria bacterium]|nr:type II secretion system protein [Candidatus Saccharibacteria bacterium]